MNVVAWDTWAFVETALGYARSDEVQALWDETEVVVTARDIIAETFTFIQRKTHNRRLARDWLQAMLASQVRIVDPSFETVCEQIQARPHADRLSWPDMALAVVAEQTGAGTIATQDKGFQSLGFATPFAHG